MTERRFLIVEDEFLLALELKALLTDAGYKVVGPASTVAAALQLIASNKPHAAFVDCNLHGELASGVALTLKAQKVPFAVVTGYDRERLPAAFSDAPFASKPFNAARLLDIARQLLSEHHAKSPRAACTAS